MKKVARHAAKVRRANAKFEKSTPSEKRVLIAQDVIAALKAEKITPIKNYYIRGNALKNAIEKSKDTVQVQDLFKKIPSCTVCARGAIFVCAVKRFDNLSCGQVKKVEDTEEVDQQVEAVHTIGKRFFSIKQLALIEQAFEADESSSNGWGGIGCSLPDSTILTSAERNKANDFGFAFKKTGDRMIAIMANIVENKGTFVP